jgi:hypothetical protein
MALLGAKFAKRLRKIANLPKEFEENRIETNHKNICCKGHLYRVLG